MLPKELETVFRQNLRLRREELGMTQTDLAEAAGLPQPHISALEVGKRSPSLQTIARLATALRCPPSWLLDPPAVAVPEKSEKPG